MNKEKIINLLYKPFWNRNDLMDYLTEYGRPHSQSTLSNIKGMLKPLKYNHSCFNPDEYLGTLGTTREKELALLKEEK